MKTDISGLSLDHGLEENQTYLAGDISNHPHNIYHSYSYNNSNSHSNYSNNNSFRQSSHHQQQQPINSFSSNSHNTKDYYSKSKHHKSSKSSNTHVNGQSMYGNNSSYRKNEDEEVVENSSNRANLQSFQQRISRFFFLDRRGQNKKDKGLSTKQISQRLDLLMMI